MLPNMATGPLHLAVGWRTVANQCLQRAQPLDHVIATVPWELDRGGSLLQVGSFIELVTIMYAVKMLDADQLRTMCEAQCDLEDQNDPLGRVPLKTHYEWDLLRDFCLQKERKCREQVTS